MYHLFSYHDYYPNGGLNDYRSSFDTIKEAKLKAMARKSDHYEIVIQRDGDYIESAKLETIEVGTGSWNDTGFIIAWEKVDGVTNE